MMFKTKSEGGGIQLYKYWLFQIKQDLKKMRKILAMI